MPVENQAEMRTPVTNISADSPADSAHHAFDQLEDKESTIVVLSQFAPSIGSGPEVAQTEARGLRWACPVKGHDQSSQLTVSVVAANAANSAQSVVQKTRASPARLVQNGSMSANMFNMNMCVLPRTNSLTRPVIQPPHQLHQGAEPSQAGVPADFEDRIRRLEDELARLRTQLSYQEHRTSELESCAAKPDGGRGMPDRTCSHKGT